MWSSGRIKVLAEHSSRLEDFKAAKKQFLERLHFYNYPKAFLELLIEEDPFTRGRIEKLVASHSETRLSVPVPGEHFLNSNR